MEFESFISLENLLPKYPNIHNTSDDVLNPYGNQKFNDVIVTKKEFADLKLPQVEPQTRKGSGDQYKHQKIIARFLSSETPYNELLLYHEMGTGKTCTAIATVENLRQQLQQPERSSSRQDSKTVSIDNQISLRYSVSSHITGAVVCAKGSALLKNFVNELLFSCTDGRYIPENYSSLTPLEKTHRVKKIVSEFYETHTFETFARELARMSDSNIILRFSNKIFIVDEVHNLREKAEVGNDSTRFPFPLSEDEDEEDRGRGEAGDDLPVSGASLDVYKQFHRLFHIVKECKILLMSGTVMKDDPAEFASVMNLILPLDRQLPVGKAFIRTYFDVDGKLNNKNNELATAIRGRVSYLKAMMGSQSPEIGGNKIVRKVFMGESNVGNLEHFVVSKLEMSAFQSDVYTRAYTRDVEDRNIFINSRQALLFAFPNGTYGLEGWNFYIEKRVVKQAVAFLRRGKTDTRTVYSLSQELVTAINKNVSNLYKFSSKYAFVIKTLLENPTWKSLVYCEYVNGGGCILFSKILELFGYREASGEEKTKGRRYIILTNQTTGSAKIQKLLARYNEPDNTQGEFISVVIGSKVISEGFTLKDVQAEFIITPHWNYSETSQVIARGWRLGSHNALLNTLSTSGKPTPVVRVYQLVSQLPPAEGVFTLDQIMYETAESKDVKMKQVEHLVKVSSFDCPLMLDRNKLVGFDGMRECDYTLCDYKCDGQIGDVLDLSTYELYYAAIGTLYENLSVFFRTNFSISLSTLETMFPTMTKSEIVASVQKLIDSSVQFLNQYGFVSFLRIQESILYLTTDARVPNDNKLLTYYNQNLLIQNGDSFDYIIKQLSVNRLPSVITTIFAYPKYTRMLVATLPNSVQRLLLQSCIEASIRNAQINTEVRDTIMDMFKGFYSRPRSSFDDKSDEIPVNKKWIVWLFKEEFGITVFNQEKDDTSVGPEYIFSRPTGLWESMDNTVAIEKQIRKKRLQVIQSPIGVYGLYNPHLDEFCLRVVSDREDDTNDLRKMVIGRRCSDWDFKTLIDIIARRIRQEPPTDYLLVNGSLPSIDRLKELAGKKHKRGSSVFNPEDFTNPEQLRRVLFWSSFNRVAVCQAIKKWLEDAGLVEENFDCGTQKKQRGKFAGKNI